MKPLFDLQADETLSGAARGIAYRLVERLGILDRRDVLEEVRGLSQDERAGLRRNGVRFGAYHIYIPALLKPGPSTLLARLKALNDGDIDRQGISEISAISASGRTSTDVDPALDADIYLQFGFRIFGRRAVRIDILERLADLIRPALSWRQGSDGERPDGAVDDGRGFMATTAMTSLLGASGDDMSTILRGLGYRLERKPAPAPENGAAEDALAGNDALGSIAANKFPAAEASDEIGAERLPADNCGSADNKTEALDGKTAAAAAAAGAGQVRSNGTGAEAEKVAVNEGEDSQSATAAESSADEPAMIEIWRPDFKGRRNRRRGGRNAEAGADGAGRDRQQRARRRQSDGRKGSSEKEGKPSNRKAVFGGQGSGRREPDPDSPFAALAALKKEMNKPGAS